MFAPQDEDHLLKGVGHWTRQEWADEVNALLPGLAGASVGKCLGVATMSRRSIRCFITWNS